MVLSFLLAGIGVAVTIALAAASVRSEALTPLAGVVAAVFGSIIVVLAGFAFLALLVLFVVASVLATRYGFEEKSEKKVQEGTHGERGVSNVLAHIVTPTALVVWSALAPSTLPVPSLVWLYSSALAFGAADTFASEFGVLSGAARSILTLRPVAPGTNGGVSLTGEFWAFLAALTTGVVALVLFFVFSTPTPPPETFLIGTTVAGFAGCQIDSVLGETLENRGLLTKGGTNVLGMISAIIVASLFVLALGEPL